jgi:hypothetical protein
MASRRVDTLRVAPLVVPAQVVWGRAEAVAGGVDDEPMTETRCNSGNGTHLLVLLPLPGWA